MRWPRRRSSPGHVAPARRAVAQSAILQVVRVLNRLVPKCEQSVLVGAPDLEDGLLALSDELLARDRRVVLLTANPLPGGFFDPRVRSVARRSPAAWWAFARSREVFTTHGVYGDLPGPPSQRRVYIWHGEPPGKLVEQYVGGPAKPSSIAPTTSRIGQAFRCAEFGLPPWQVPITGAPRNDRMLRAERSPEHPLLTSRTRARTVLLWLPTYRAAEAGHRRRVDSDRGYAGTPYSVDELRRIDARLAAADIAVFVKLHPFAVDSYDLETTSIIPITDATLHAHRLTTYTAVPRFAGLVTDISSIWIDYLLLDSPLIFAFPDIDEYRSRRGFALEPFDDWAPGPLATDVDGLIDAIDAVGRGEDPYARQRARVARLLHRHQDDRAASRLVDLMLTRGTDGPTDERFTSTATS